MPNVQTDLPEGYQFGDGRLGSSPRTVEAAATDLLAKALFGEAREFINRYRAQPYSWRWLCRDYDIQSGEFVYTLRAQWQLGFPALQGQLGLPALRVLAGPFKVRD